MVDWGEAFEVFFVGFGGVVTCLVILQACIIIFSKIASGNEKTGENKNNG
ncbi:MAG: hypothetical protein J7L53_08260 [Deltaproteobacteria bacterium]|nr:hypothetical protein [Deltaproteobacteria bacterium]